MKNKSLYVSMLVLVICFLISLYVLKIFFTQEFAISVQNQTLVGIGNYIDNNAWLYYLFGIANSFLTYSLYFSATCRRLFLKWYEYLAICGIIGISIALKFINIELCGLFSIVAMLLIPLAFSADNKAVLVVFSTHYTAQWLTLKIRNLPMYLASSNRLIMTILSLDMFLWLLLFYILYNIKKKEV